MERSLAGRIAHGPGRRGTVVVLASTAALVLALGLPHATASDPLSPGRPSAIMTGQVGAAAGASGQHPSPDRAVTGAPRSVTVPTPVPVASPPVSTPRWPA